MNQGAGQFGNSGTSMAATSNTPQIGVHVLTEFVFCPRAGVIAFEEERDDPGEDMLESPRLDYLPDFSVRLIEEALQNTWNRIWRTLTFASPMGLVIFGVHMFGHSQLAVVLAIGLGGWLLYWLWQQLRVVVLLQRKLRAAATAVPDEPDSGLSEIQEVNWWSLLKAGFAPLEYEDPHEDREWKLVGKPWRVLQKGPLRIPVFRKRYGEPELFPQHYARMAAYCHLLEVCEGAESPYGVILFGDGYEGVTIPNSSVNRDTFEEGLRKARRIVESLEKDNLIPGKPDRPVICHDCPVGRPHSHRKGRSETVLRGKRIPPFLTLGEDKRIYHSRCGDRFGWVPPHDRATRKKLL